MYFVAAAVDASLPPVSESLNVFSPVRNVAAGISTEPATSPRALVTIP